MPAHPLSSDDGLKEAARSTLRELLTIAKRYRKRRQRLDTLFLFDGRSRAKAGKTYATPRATVEYEDAPEMELILKHRDSYDRLAATIDQATESINRVASKIDPDDPYTLKQMLQSVATLERQGLQHLDSIREILQQFGRELIAQESTLAKVVAEGAKLSQLAIINREKLTAEADRNGIGVNNKSTTELETMAKDIHRRIANGEMFVVESEDEEDH